MRILGAVKLKRKAIAKMTPRQEVSETGHMHELADDLQRRLITTQDFLAWQKKNAASLINAGDVRRAAQVAVNRAITSMLRKGLALNDAGDILVNRRQGGCHDGVYFPPTAVRSALLAIGWRPPHVRVEGDEV